MKHLLFVLTIIIFLMNNNSAVCSEETDTEGKINDSRLTELLDKIEINFGQIKSIKTQLTQEKSIHVFSDTVISKGFCFFKNPNKLRLEFTEPFKSVLIVNGKDVAKYEYFQDQWQKLDSGNRQVMLMIMKNITSWLQGKFRDTNLYEISAFQHEKIKVVLVPKSKEFKDMISAFEMGINETVTGLDYITIHEKKKDYTKILFHHDVIDGDIPESIFDTKGDIPQAVDIW